MYLYVYFYFTGSLQEAKHSTILIKAQNAQWSTVTSRN